MTWVPNISYIVDHVDHVSAKDTNRPLQQLDLRTQYLYQALLSSTRGELILARNVPISSNMPLGSPVCLKNVGGNFVYTLAKAGVQESLNDIIPTQEMILRGVLVADYANGRGDIAIAGKIDAHLFKIDWTKVFEPPQTTLIPGHYFVSARYAGKMTLTRSTHAYAYIGSLDGQGNLIVTPFVGGSLAEHRHYRFQLNRTVTTHINTEGWLPVSMFEAVHVPPGAVYGYNINKHPLLKAYFPAFPPSACQLYLTGVIVPTNLWKVTEYGIWWMSSTHAPSSTDIELGIYTTVSAPKTHFDLYVTHYPTTHTPSVESISTVSDTHPSRLPITIEHTAANIPIQEHAFGHVRLSLHKSAHVADTGNNDVFAVKTVSGVVAERGPVLVRLKPGAGISLSSAHGNTNDGYYGTVTISATLAEQLEGQPTLVSLDNAIEDLYGDIPVLAFPQGRQSRMMYKLYVPLQLSSTRNMIGVLDCLGTAAHTATLDVGHIIARHGYRVPQTWAGIHNVNLSLSAGYVTRVELNPISVQPGDTVYISIAQNQIIPYTIPVIRFSVTYATPS